MALTATILDDNEIILNLVPVTSELVEPIEYRDVGTLGATVGLPIVNVREMSTTVRVKNGEMLVIGGLISEIQETEGNFAPVVGKIPLFRYLFGYEEKINQKRELIILLEDRVII
jgi:type II secretory pathway component GspD/PulD (secretin)